SPADLSPVRRGKVGAWRAFCMCPWKVIMGEPSIGYAGGKAGFDGSGSVVSRGEREISCFSATHAHRFALVAFISETFGAAEADTIEARTSATAIVCAHVVQFRFKLHVLVIELHEDADAILPAFAIVVIERE